MGTPWVVVVVASYFLDMVGSAVVVVVASYFLDMCRVVVVVASYFLDME